MPTINQLVRMGRTVVANKSNSPALDSCPRSGASASACTPPPQEAELRASEWRGCGSPTASR